MLNWDTLSKILNVILAFWSVYLYVENRKLKGFKVDRDIKLKELEIEEVKRWYPKRKGELDNEMAERGLTFSGIRKKAEEDLKKEYENKLNKLEAELEYLKKLKRYKWIFSDTSKLKCLGFGLIVSSLLFFAFPQCFVFGGDPIEPCLMVCGSEADCITYNFWGWLAGWKWLFLAGVGLIIMDKFVKIREEDEKGN